MSEVISAPLDRSKWIEIFPYGVSVGTDQSRPVMIFKDKSERQIVPVWMSPLDAGIAITQTDTFSAANSPHQLAWQLLQTLGVRLERVLFKEIRGHHQFIELQFSGSRKLKMITVRAAEAISFCLAANPSFYCQFDFIEKCRRMEIELLSIEDRTRNANLVTERPPYLN